MPKDIRVYAVCILILTAGLAMLAGCTATPETPTLDITSPSNGATVRAGDIEVRTEVDNFNVVDKQGQGNVSGEGHLHFYMDVTPLPSAAGVPAIPSDPNAAWAHISDTEYTFPNVTPGTHTFAVLLVNNDHTPIVPMVSDMVTVTVTA